MTDDLVKRLMACSIYGPPAPGQQEVLDLIREAAQEIERLEYRNANQAKTIKRLETENHAMKLILGQVEKKVTKDD